MYRDSEQALESIFVSYNKILKRFKLLGVTTKCGKEITHGDLKCLDINIPPIIGTGTISVFI